MISITNDIVYVWELNCENYFHKQSNFLKLLSEDEKKRALQYSFEKDRRKFIIQRGILRIIISKFLQIPPINVQFKYTILGKPEIANCPKLKFNLSHVGNYVLYAFAFDKNIGIDLECLRSFLSLDGLIRRYFSDEENRILSKLDEHAKQDAFLKGWVQKEAIAKSLGLGLTLSLRHIEVNLKQGPPRLIRFHHATFSHQDWLLFNLDTTPPFKGIIAVNTKESYVKIQFSKNLHFL